VKREAQEDGANSPKEQTFESTMLALMRSHGCPDPFWEAINCHHAPHERGSST